MSEPANTPATPLTPQERYEAALAALNPKQRRFVVEYLACLNASEASRRAGYSAKTAGAIGSENLKKPDIAEAVAAGMDLQAMPTEEILARLSAQARGDMGDFLRVDEEDVTLTWSLISAPIDPESGEVDVGGLAVTLAMQGSVQPTDRVLHTVTVKRSVARLDMLAAGQAGKLGLVRKYGLDKDGKISIELYDAQKALELLGKHRGLFVERQELTGAGGAPLAMAPIREVVIERPVRADE